MNGEILDKNYEWGSTSTAKYPDLTTAHEKSFALHILTDVFIRTPTRFLVNTFSHAAFAAWCFSAQTEPVYPIAFAEPAAPTIGPGPGSVDLRRR